MNSRIAQFETAFDSNQALGQGVARQLLLRVGDRQMPKVLNDRRLTAFQVRQAPLDVSQRPLHVCNVGADGTQLRQNQVFGSVDHAPHLSTGDMVG
jgi:hypothetical protein